MRKSKYTRYKSEILEIKKDNPTMGSDAIADIIGKKYQGVSIPSLGRTIRKYKWIEIEESKVIEQAKILLFDIETSPIIAPVWSLWNQNINSDQILRDWNILCWSAKYLFEDKIYSMKLNKRELKEGDDKRITEGLWQMLDDANIVIAHNLKKFDKKKAQTRFLKHKMGLPNHYQEIDTLVSARKQFAISSNRLDFIAKKFFEVEGKMETEKGLWDKVMGNPYKGIAPDVEALDRMGQYCDQDVRVLEEVYLRLRPYITNHPNVALFIGSEFNICKACGSPEFEPIGEYTTIVNIYEGYRCRTCGSVHRSRKAITPKKLRDALLR